MKFTPGNISEFFAYGRKFPEKLLICKIRVKFTFLLFTKKSI